VRDLSEINLKNESEIQLLKEEHTEVLDSESNVDTIKLGTSLRKRDTVETSAEDTVAKLKHELESKGQEIEDLHKQVASYEN
jgi:hypothetical protein